MSEAVTRAAYKFVEAQENYTKVNEELNQLYDEFPNAIFDEDSHEDRWEEAWEAYSAARADLVATVLTERSGVNFG